MVSSLNKDGGRRRKNLMGPFKGVRMRKWGRWVSEIRIPQSKTRIWLGSYDAPEKAARAYDAALYCLRGLKGTFNFPNDKRPEIPVGSSIPLSKAEIQAVAARFASSNCMFDPSSGSSFTTFTISPVVPVTDGVVESACILPEVPIADSGVDSTCKVGIDPLFADGESGESEMFWPESFLLDEPLMLEPDSLWDILDEPKHIGEM